MGDGNYPHRILIVADEGIARDAYRKVATRLSELADGLKQRHCDVEIALLRGDADVVAALRERGHAAHPVGWDAYRHTPRAVRRLVHLLGSGSFDIVMGREVIPAIISGAAARLSRSPVTSQFVRCHTHGRLALNWTSFVAANVSHQVLAISEAVARCSLRLDRIDPRRVRVITQGRSAMRQPSDLELLKARQQAGIKGSAPVLVVVARLRNEKGVDLAISAMKEIRASFEPAPEMVIVGSGPEEGPLRRLVAGLTSGIHFVGHHDDVAPWLALADVVVVPSRKEALGYVPVEAMSLAKPVIASDIGGLPEVVLDQETGYLVTPGDPHAIAERALHLIRDPSLRRRMGAAGRVRYDKAFTLDLMLDGWMRVWNEGASSVVTGVM